MKRELALQLLRRILDDPPWTEDRLRETVEQLRVLAEHKYNKYEMYQPARSFFESLYLFLARLRPEHRTAALEFTRDNIVFVSREEFQQLAHILYYDRIRQKQLDFTAALSGLPRHRLRQLSESPIFKRLQRASLYVGLSDGARIDYFRRQNLDVNNEQVLAAYYAGEEKITDVGRKLAEALGETDAKFDCLFLLDDFCGSGRTLLREVAVAGLAIHVVIPNELQGRLKYDPKKRQLEWNYRGAIEEKELVSLRSISADPIYLAAVEQLADKCRTAETEVRGALVRIAKELLLQLVSDHAKVYFSPLLATQYALGRLQPLLHRLPAPLDRLELLPGAVLSDGARIRPGEGVISEICEQYYSSELEDEHTGYVKFGYDGCGLPLILHHNTPNNSLYFLWARKWKDPLFVRYERHGREVRS
jgi:hypothetical protein